MKIKLFQSIARTGVMLCLSVLTNSLVMADGLDQFKNFIENAQSGRSAFTQTVTAPTREGETASSKRSSGRFSFLRPGKFRFDYDKPFEQQIVADGHDLWLYDVDLEQVTRRPQADVLGQTPAALIAASTDLKSLRADFDISEEPDADGLQWVKAIPKTADGQLKQVRLGFSGSSLAQLEILDNFGQRSMLEFLAIELNPALPADTFTFTPPAGIDVLRP